MKKCDILNAKICDRMTRTAMITIENANKFMFEKLEKLRQQQVFENKKIILFGLNTSSYASKQFLEDRGYPIYAYMDNDRKKRDDLNEYLDEIMPRHFQSKEYRELVKHSIRAYKPEELLKDFDNSYVILIASKYYNQMREQLESLGYQENKHIFQTVDFFGLDKLLDQDHTTTQGLGLEKLSQEEVRRIQIEITNYLKEVCKQYNLRYYMGGGTLLGAVRHKGYIPWDDDIDIIMPMQDYLKFLDILKEDERYEILSIYNHPDTYFNFFSRLIDKQTVMKTWEYPFLMTGGVSIDVFPLVGLPYNAKEVQSFFNRIRNRNSRFINSFISFSEETEEVKQYRAKLRDEIISMMKQYDFDTSTQAGYILSRYWEKDIMPREIYDNTIEMQFEDEIFAAPAGYHIYLESFFGDYMQLPPESERHAPHNYVAYRKTID